MGARHEHAWRALAFAALLVFGMLPAAHAQTTTGICGRTALVQEVILAKVTRTSDCAAVTAADLSGLTGALNLGRFSLRMPIPSLKAGDFRGMTGLGTLDLGGGHGLTTLPANVFDDLTSVTTLDLTGNSLSVWPKDVLDALTSLTALGMGNNVITVLPANAFSGLTNLRFLELNGNRLSTVPANVFSGLSELTNLQLYGNPLTGLPANAFSGLGKLADLSLATTGLTSLPADVFSGLAKLTNLVLPKSLTTLAVGAFNGLSPRVVEVSGIELPEVPGNFTATATGRVIVASWSALSGAHYYLSWKQDSASEYAPQDAAATGRTSHTISNLESSTEYDLRIASLPNSPTAQVQNNKNLWSSWPTEATTGDPSAPGMPQNLRAISANNQLEVTWTAPADDGGAAVATYHLRWKSAAETAFAGTDAATTNAGTTAYTVTGVSSGTTYTVEVAAENTLGIGAYATAEATGFSLDVDGNGEINAADGIMVARYLFGVTGGDGLVDGQADPAAAAGVSAQIKIGKDDMTLDADGDNDVDGDDGLLFARYLLGLRGDALIRGFPSNVTAADVISKIEELRTAE